ncbi:MAG TPA: DUF6089 family protein [Cyclobacteriaceae bacterium]|nr:DUF6089 family protein [Cyclobacteriaceae bacterium]
MKKARFYILCKLVLGSLMILINSQVQAQQYEVGLGLGGATYTGDIIRHIDPSQVGIQGTLFGRRNFDNAWSLRAGISIARLNGTDSISPIDALAFTRDAYFTGTVFEAAAVMEFHFLDYLSHQSQTRYSPYGFFGLGYTIFSGEGQSFKGDPAAGDYTASTPVIPFGLGVKYKLKDRLLLSMEMGFRATFIDYIDKVEDRQEYVPKYLESDPVWGDDATYLNPPYFNFGNRHDKDWYYFLGISLSYSFHQIKCFTY